MFEYPLRRDDGLAVHRLILGPLDTNVYLVVDEDDGSALVVDAADDATSILAACAGLSVMGVVTTHGHWDHVGATDEVAGSLGVPSHIHPADHEASRLGIVEPLSDGDVLTVGSHRLEVRHTPGHTPGSVCLAAPGLLLTGDTLFPGGPGATRGDTAAFARIMRSLRTRLFVEPDSTRVLPGHGDPTTIGTERPSLDEWERRGW